MTENDLNLIKKKISEIIDEALEDLAKSDKPDVSGEFRGIMEISYKLKNLMEEEQQNVVIPAYKQYSIPASTKRRRKKHSRLTDSEIESMKHLKSEGMPIRRIAETLDVSYATVSRFTKDVPVYDKNKTVGLETIKWIKELHSEGHTVEEIADVIEIPSSKVKEYL